MTWIPGGTFTMGSERFYPEEAPLRRVAVDGFWIDIAPVTNRRFAAFVEATGYTTVAEIVPDRRDYPGMLPGMDRAGSLVFHKSRTPVDTSNPANWWAFEFGADWHYPLGPDSDVESLGLWDHPVVQIAYADAEAYARWAGKDLPTEAEFEFAARGGLEGADYAWGDELAPDGAMMANYWQGLFPFANQMLDGWERTSPVGTYPANGYGLVDMIGNSWEWTSDWWADTPETAKKKAGGSCCTLSNPRGGKLKDSFDPSQPAIRIGRKVLKGGSHLCAANYCQRYRPAARHPEMIDSSTSHIGFRCVLRSTA
ncbi:formylglycine-generating enzyme family protein [Novosphingobium sp. P6W]|uniref:formylglycine-generating enzyme family protein n=1 Tax=Novosphingobium sp. P6W TaxID=1609758 RepID=UPI0005C2BBD3|nr:formylglycine-generating enzyme family protein [Novosphingobium sp. P6W]AXB78017.1 formylglycine-generating enzyme family protein [Novosphingobium sp. P6W]KIS33512.1 gliding motility-associated lipoprotein GldK [Novosphingobium sp. P6W]